MDHLIGLERPEFGKYVAKINAPIYMSEISKSFLSTMTLYRHLVPYFKSVPLEQAFPLKIQSIDPVQAKKKDGGDMETLKTTLCSHTPNVDETILVTCFGSGHCPGSIMILIEGEHGTVLFTGDYRFYHGQTKRLTHLYRNGIDDARFLMKTIDNLYIDMTFFRPEILHIPTREFSCEVLIEWVKKEIKSNPSVQFYFRARFRRKTNLFSFVSTQNRLKILFQCSCWLRTDLSFVVRTFGNARSRRTKSIRFLFLFADNSRMFDRRSEFNLFSRLSIGRFEFFSSLFVVSLQRKADPNSFVNYVVHRTSCSEFVFKLRRKTNFAFVFVFFEAKFWSSFTNIIRTSIKVLIGARRIPWKLFEIIDFVILCIRRSRKSATFSKQFGLVEQRRSRRLCRLC